MVYKQMDSYVDLWKEKHSTAPEVFMIMFLNSLKSDGLEHTCIVVHRHKFLSSNIDTPSRDVLHHDCESSDSALPRDKHHL